MILSKLEKAVLVLIVMSGMVACSSSGDVKPSESAQNLIATLAIQQIGGSPGPFADTCDMPRDLGNGPALANWPIFPEGEFPIGLPEASFLGAPNIGPNPYRQESIGVAFPKEGYGARLWA